ncbi:CZB domain-containing protein [Hymenobacter latericus]|uniref:CZB domain-containing protein n=1 Tax=Hymenobacter sp. YIM 151858-1 TaxID=2987688 RepID=UPI0022271AEE|nr:CZB domain-containing protein [Hymenobacter sp. YIM 151858-1]UYZ59245.1 CZB domain-containing protein [Hymenobacter sp. YIM 151858-1]
MSEDIKREINAARLKHILFKAKLRSFLYGSGTDEAPVRDPDVCGLGQWISHVALPQFGHMPETQKLDRIHRQLHQMANKLMDLRQAGQAEQAQRGLSDINPLTDEVLELINTIERKLRKEGA